MDTARSELVRGFQGMLRRELKISPSVSRRAVILGTVADIKRTLPDVNAPKGLQPDGYWLKSTKLANRPVLLVTASTDRGVLYGVFALLRRIALQQPLSPSIH